MDCLDFYVKCKHSLPMKFRESRKVGISRLLELLWLKLKDKWKKWTKIKKPNHFWAFWFRFLSWSLITDIALNIPSPEVIIIDIMTRFRPTCPLAFSRCFMLNSGAHREPQNEPFIWSTGVDRSSSINHNQVQVLNYCKYLSFFNQQLLNSLTWNT